MDAGFRRHDVDGVGLRTGYSVLDGKSWMAGSAPAFGGMTGLDGRGRGCRPITWDEAAHAMGRLVQCAVDDEPPPRSKSFLLPRAGSLFFKKEALSCSCNPVHC